MYLYIVGTLFSSSSSPSCEMIRSSGALQVVSVRNRKGKRLMLFYIIQITMHHLLYVYLRALFTHVSTIVVCVPVCDLQCVVYYVVYTKCDWLLTRCSYCLCLSFFYVQWNGPSSRDQVVSLYHVLYSLLCSWFRCHRLSLPLLSPSLFPFTRPSLTERAHTPRRNRDICINNTLSLWCKIDSIWFTPVPGGGGRKKFKIKKCTALLWLDNEFLCEKKRKLFLIVATL
jgi:hypothetical protein